MEQKLRAARVFPPSRILQRELEARNLSKDDLRKVSDNLPQIIESIIEGYQPITHDIALELSKLLETSAEFWLNLEENYRQYLAQKAIQQSIIRTD